MGSSRIYSRALKTEPFPGYPGPVIEYALDSAAAASWASSILPSALPALLGLQSGTWMAPLPKETPQDVANRFSGGVLPEPPISEWQSFDPHHFGPEMSERIASSFGCSTAELVVIPKYRLVPFAADWAASYLASSSTALVLIREMSPSVNTDIRVAWQTPMGVFYPVCGSGLDRNGIADIIEGAAVAQGEFMMFTRTGGLDASAAKQVSDEELRRLIQDADSIVLGAYDGEGYVRWNRLRSV